MPIGHSTTERDDEQQCASKALRDVNPRNRLHSQKEDIENHQLNDYPDVSNQIENEYENESETEVHELSNGGARSAPTAKCRMRKWKTVRLESLPEWMQDDPYVLRKHRPQLPSYSACLKSIFALHSETGNIWTHLLGFLAFVALAIWFLTRKGTDVQGQEKILFTIFFASAIICLGMSFTFHTVSCHSPGVYKFFQKLDHIGISVLIVGSFVPWLYYGFYCRRAAQIAYIAIICGLGIAAIAVTLGDWFNGPKRRVVIASIFSAMGLSAVVPVFHFMVVYGMRILFEDASLLWLLLMAFLYLAGGAIYAALIPERFFPGKCDLWCQSHQLFHICVVAAAFVHYYGILEVSFYRVSHGANCTELELGLL